MSVQHCLAHVNGVLPSLDDDNDALMQSYLVVAYNAFCLYIVLSVFLYLCLSICLCYSIHLHVLPTNVAGEIKFIYFYTECHFS